MWVTFGVIALALLLYATERLPLEVTSLGVICVLLVIFQLAPVRDASGDPVLTAGQLLAGFANPALITVVALLVLGQGLAQTGVLERGAALLLSMSRGQPGLATLIAFSAVLLTSGFLNNTPVVVIFIPIMQAIADRFGNSPSRFMIPLSYAAIVGGMITLIGSSTNILVSGMMVDLGRAGFGFFDFTLPGLVLAVVGLAYVLWIAPLLLPDRAALTSTLAADGRQFISQIRVTEGGELVGMRPQGGFFPSMKDVTVRSVQRGEHAYVPPFDSDLALCAGDIMIVAATRKTLTTAVGGRTKVMHADYSDDESGHTKQEGPEQIIAEVMITPTSRLVGRSLEQIGFRYQYQCIVLGIQRRLRMIRSMMTEIRLEAGDVLLIQGRRSDVNALRRNPDILLIEWSATEVPAVHHARRAVLIFLGVIVAAASGLVPIVVSALTGVFMMLVTGVLNVRQATRAIDRTVVFMIAAALALGAALQATGGAPFLADAMLAALGDASPGMVLSATFLLVALLANAISTKTAAVLFTPIAVGIADRLGVPAEAFAVAVIFAANCAFASPVGYQTNMLVIAPGHYRFVDFVRAGLPLTFVIWIVFSLFAPWYYGL